MMYLGFPASLSTSHGTQNRAGRVDGLHGANRDWARTTACIRRNLSPIDAAKPGTVDLVLWAGGMSRAAVFSMISLGVRNITHNRTLHHAKQVDEHFHGRTSLSRSRGLVEARIDSTIRKYLPPTAYPTQGSCVINMLPSIGPWPVASHLATTIVSCTPAHYSDPFSMNDLVAEQAASWRYG